MIILCCGCSCGLFLEKNWVVVGVVVSYCTKIVLMLLLGCVIKSNCGCGCGRSSQVDCVVVVVVVDQFSFCSSLTQTPVFYYGNQFCDNCDYKTALLDNLKNHIKANHKSMNDIDFIR